MSSRVPKEISSRGIARARRVAATPDPSTQTNGKKDLDTSYIDEFIENGLKLHDELMVNHDAMRAARAEHLAEFRRKRHLR